MECLVAYGRMVHHSSMGCIPFKAIYGGTLLPSFFSYVSGTSANLAVDIHLTDCNTVINHLKEHLL